MVVNPFSTKFWTAGVIPFQFSLEFSESHESIDTLLEKMRRYPICQIVGPHGSGKSTLLRELLKQYEKREEDVRYLFFNEQHRRIPRDVVIPENSILFVDGFEQLPFIDRIRSRFRAKRLILTAHRPVWFVPILYRTKPQFSVFVQAVRQMSADSPEECVLREVYERSGGNFRNAFFELYDLWEEVKSGQQYQ